ncbi:MAG: inositol monophosphatase [Leptolyngbyaceae cyanobacterium SL_7_1]|nr:inositol monophosphatase [Leptolyngbyaceae cyanobacterium SL_7_1]
MTDWNAIATTVEAITTEVGAKLLQDFGQVQASEKADGSLVTRSDQWADNRLREAIAQAFPDHGILSEEGDQTFPDREWCWIIDPLDGTTNYTRGLPLWSISLGLLYQGVPVFGLIDVPPLRQTFQGVWIGASGLPGTSRARLNHQPIQTTPDDPSSNHFFNLCARSTAVMKQPFPCKIRMLGSASYNLLMVAAGVAVGGVEATPKIWDIAAVWAIVHAAGGTWVALDNQPVFPLQPGENYRDRSYPTLVVSRAELVDRFQPLVGFLANKA